MTPLKYDSEPPHLISSNLTPSDGADLIPSHPTSVEVEVIIGRHEVEGREEGVPVDARDGVGILVRRDEEGVRGGGRARGGC